MMVVGDESHADHGLTAEQMAFLVNVFKKRNGFFIETVKLPPELGTVPCGLYGPSMNDAPVADSEVSLAQRGDRQYMSRLIHMPARQVDTVTVIAGPNGVHPCYLYTAFGGPAAPKEPGEIQALILDMEKTIHKARVDLMASSEFWSKHALSSSIAPMERV